MDTSTRRDLQHLLPATSADAQILALLDHSDALESALRGVVDWWESTEWFSPTDDGPYCCLRSADYMKLEHVMDAARRVVEES